MQIPHPKYQALQIGTKVPPEILKQKISDRLLARLKIGMLTEAKRLHESGLSWKRMEELGLEYRYQERFLQGKITKEQMTEQLKNEIWHYARRQMTWFRRDKRIKWIAPDTFSLNSISNFFNH